jgi:SH3 domain-containing protein
MRTRNVAAMAVCVILACPPLVAGDEQSSVAQPARRAATPSTPTRGFLTLGGGLQSAGGTTFGETHGEELYGEEFTWDSRYTFKESLAFEGGIGARVWRNLLTGVTYSRSEHRRPATVSGQVPHPFQFGQPRTIEGESSALRNEEQAIHLSALLIVPLGRRLEVSISGGPSLFMVRRGFVEQVEFAQDYPYDTARFTQAVSKESSEKAYGGHAGVDLMWLLTRDAGLGVFVRFTRGSIDFTTPSGGSLSLDAGGLQTGVAMRLGFGRRATRPAPPPPKPVVPVPGQVKGFVLEDRGVIIETAPVYLLPDPKRDPLRMLTPGMTVRILEETGDWFRVEFRDQQFGPRVGYVLRKYVERPKDK